VAALDGLLAHGPVSLCVVIPGYEWDDKKAASNFAKHGVSFEEAATVFLDPLAASILDPDHTDDDEERWVTTGFSSQQRCVQICHTYRGEVIRIIGVRPTTPAERRAYESGEE
jgi:uncharacterized DUF497 family protein